MGVEPIMIAVIVWVLGFILAILLSFYVIFNLTNPPVGITRPFTKDTSDEQLDLLVAYSVLFSLMFSWIWVGIMGTKTLKHYFKTLNSYGREE